MPKPKRGCMPEASELLAIGNCAIVAPAGHGKTEVIATAAGYGHRTLILTHTHAGVHAIRARLKRLGIPRAKVAVDTIASWAMRYARAFPGVAHPPPGMPKGAEWDQLHRGALLALGVNAVREVVAASYDRILIDEYQDCNGLQHELAVELSGIVPTMVFGDPMQGIFEFAGARLGWDSQIHQHFPFAGTLETPHRWAVKNPELGQWIAETRKKLMRGEPIDLADPRISYRESDDAFDMGALFEGMDVKEGSFAAIHCNKTICYNLARAASGGYQAIEEVAARRVLEFAAAWDGSAGALGRLAAIKSLIDDCFHKKKPAEGAPADPADMAAAAALNALARRLGEGSGADVACELMTKARNRPSWKLFRYELWRDAARSLAEVAAGRGPTVEAATNGIRRRINNSGRKLPKRTVSTPLLLKGLEFDHVVIPDATHFAKERYAQAKLFYVAISRATRSLTIASSKRVLQFEAPAL